MREEAPEPASTGSAAPAAVATTAAVLEGWSAIHESLGEAVVVPAGTPILDAALDQGVFMDHGCRVGACGACAIEVVSGLANVEPPDPIEADALGRYRLGDAVRLACRACLRGPVTIRSL